MLKKLAMFTLLLSSFSSYAERVDCGFVEIEQVITGPRHGSLLNISNNDCGNSGYVCIDLEGQYSSVEKGAAAYSFALASHMAGKQVQVTVETSSKPSSCGGSYPLVEDIRSKY